MNISDFTILYLSVGAPCGVYYFFQNRLSGNSNSVRIKSIMTILFWMPFACLLMRKIIRKKYHDILKKSESSFFAAEDELIDSARKLFETTVSGANSALNIFEIREIVERYTELTKALMSQNGAGGTNETEIFKFSNHTNIELGAKCLHRRNRLRLTNHQIQARQEFLNLIRIKDISGSPAAQIKTVALNFVQLLRDLETTLQIEKLFTECSQSAAKISVEQREKTVWNSKPPLTTGSKLSMPLQKLTTTVSRGKD